MIDCVNAVRSNAWYTTPNNPLCWREACFCASVIAPMRDKHFAAVSSLNFPKLLDACEDRISLPACGRDNRLHKDYKWLRLRNEVSKPLAVVDAFLGVVA